METYLSHSAKETKAIAYELAKKITSGVIALTGDLGSGKTTFAQGFAEGLKIKEKIISPTFIIVRQHKIPKTKKIFYHIDLYRLEDKQSLKGLGLEEIINHPQNIVLIEWAEKIKHILPKNTIWISFQPIDDQTRSITIL